MSFINEDLTHPVPILSSIESQNLSGKEPKAAAGSEDEKFAEQPLEILNGDSNPDVVLGDSDVILVDYEENDPENPLNWSPTQKWLMVFVISWMGFVR